jgi:hypothetical protein
VNGWVSDGVLFTMRSANSTGQAFGLMNHDTGVEMGVGKLVLGGESF